MQEIDEDAYRRFEAVLEGGLRLPGDSTPRTLLKAKNKAGALDDKSSAPAPHAAPVLRMLGLWLACTTSPDSRDCPAPYLLHIMGTSFACSASAGLWPNLLLLAILAGAGGKW